MDPIKEAIKKVADKNIKVDKVKKERDEFPKEAINLAEGPCLYLDDKELPSLPKYKSGDTVVLVIECKTKTTDSHSSWDEKTKKTTKRHSATLEIKSFADITESESGEKE